jgi:hypothetical protein
VNHNVAIARIELGDVEAALSSDPAIAQAVVVVRDSAGDNVLVGYYVGRQEPAPSPDNLRRFLVAKIPQYRPRSGPPRAHEALIEALAGRAIDARSRSTLDHVARSSSFDRQTSSLQWCSIPCHLHR